VINRPQDRARGAGAHKSDRCLGTQEKPGHKTGLGCDKRTKVKHTRSLACFGARGPTEGLYRWVTPQKRSSKSSGSPPPTKV
jgi:hypothetical protein